MIRIRDTLDRHRPAGALALDHRRATLHADADDPCRRRPCLDRACDAGDQPAAGERHDHPVELRQLFRDLQAERPLSRDHVAVVEGRYQDHALPGHQRIGILHRRHHAAEAGAHQRVRARRRRTPDSRAGST